MVRIDAPFSFHRYGALVSWGAWGGWDGENQNVCWSLSIREAIGYQIRCFFTHCVKGGKGGVEPMCKNLCCIFLQFWRPSDNLELTQKKF